MGPALAMASCVACAGHLCGNQPVKVGYLRKLHAIEQTQLRRQHRVDGVGRPKFDFHTQVAANKARREKKERDEKAKVKAAADKKAKDEKLRREKKAIQEKADAEKKKIGGSWSPLTGLF